jgi:RNA polymerase sigma-70 factor (ECF subfamily)
MSDFLKTNWDLVLAAQGGNEGSDAALQELCHGYWRPVYSFLCRSGLSRDQAEDMAQAFFLRFVEKDMAARADPARGRFRNYLLACVRNFVADERKSASARKRQPEGGFEFLDDDSYGRRAEQLQELAGRAPSPEEAFEASFASDVVESTLERLRRKHSKKHNDDPIEMKRLEIELGFLLDPQPPSFTRAAETLGLSEAALKMSVSRLRKRLGKAIEEELAGRVPKIAERDSSADFESGLEDDLRYVLTRFKFRERTT